MGITVYEHGLEDGLEYALRDRSRGPTLARARRKLMDGAYRPNWLVEAIFQNADYRLHVSIADAYGFSLIWPRLLTGQIGVLALDVGADPSGDINTDENRRKLSSLSDVDVVVDPQRGMPARNDGFVSWDRPLTFGRFFVANGVERDEPWVCDSGSIALEIGTTFVARTFFHLLDGGVARWAYGSKRLVLLRRHPSWTMPEFGSSLAGASKP